ncbi:ribonuclease Z [Fictibacillus sp. KU28468]|uniref:ribonuclease Z n=1 Tax=Fictibacillus sp. KU28468 TaxID=2991053 RepID=UPI00223D9D02|nr:ribonuclease Z [Fictibacillus sp. KU28468]UZJ80731.1 ribonuclease Z [Fictibacillus sp. KU28468]
MELHFLGTGAGMPSKERNVSSVALKFLQTGGEIWLFDCGEATQHQILHTSLKPRKINKIFITHLHGDHLFGLPGLLGSRSFQNGEESPVSIYGPKGIKAFIDTSLNISQTHLTYPIQVIEIDEGLICEEEGRRVYAKQLEHVIPCFGFRVEEQAQPGKLEAGLLKKMGLPPGPLYQQLKEGRDITLEDGTVLKSSDFVSPPVPGRIVAILGDTKYCENAVELGRDAEVLIHEATVLHELAEKAAEFGHSSARSAAVTARQANAAALILNHISSRYHKEEKTLLLKEAREVFPNTQIADDFSVFPIEKLNKK